MDYVIVGNCAACVNAIEGIRSIDEKVNIRVVTDEEFPAYCRCLISEYVAGTHDEKKLLLRDKEFYKKRKVELILGKKVVDVKPQERIISLAGGGQMSYDKLLLATGSSPKPLGIEGENKEGVFSFRTLIDAKRIAGSLSKGIKVVVFGGGFIGLKAAYALKKKGVDVEVVVKSPRILSQVLDAGSAGLVRKWLEENGMKIKTGLGPAKILGEKKVDSVLFDNGEKLECQVVIVGKCVEANTTFLNNSGIKTHWGVITDEYLRTSVEAIYAAGDVAETRSLITGKATVTPLWTCATEQGRIAGINMAGGKKVYPGSIPANSIDFFGLPFVAVGHVRFKEGEGIEEKVIAREEKYIYKKAFIKGKRLLGVTLVGKIENAGVYLALIRKKADISSVKDYLLEESFNYGKVAGLLEGDEGFRESISSQGDLIKMA
jgi:NAD(P)H-nitrite reductase large subunit